MRLSSLSETTFGYQSGRLCNHKTVENFVKKYTFPFVSKSIYCIFVNNNKIFPFYDEGENSNSG
jgi:hypothetical protein